ncbi:GNAT family N-acetyltransferase [Streptomyces apocyni]|uniref:GNAT family N-acetyltransferase n=1 Tax=Streptomyces apocyni TaxID=2654677 RepID=UPI0012EAB113|nr:GNAT family N-acetyltransferase [Streptomyces apocyni]
MTTTLRPTGPLQSEADGARSRPYDVCVNSRPVGRLDLATHLAFGPTVGQIRALRIEEPDRRRGRATVAALAAEEILRGWRCTRVEAIIPADAAAAVRLATVLGYVERNRTLSKPLPGQAPDLPDGSVGRPMSDAEYGPWLAHAKEHYARDWMAQGIPESQAYAKSEADHAAQLPDGTATDGVRLRVLEHLGTAVGTLWVTVRDSGAYVFDVEVAEEYRGRGHGRSLLRLAEREALSAGARQIGLNVFTNNTPAMRLYASLGYQPTAYHLSKPLL